MNVRPYERTWPTRTTSFPMSDVLGPRAWGGPEQGRGPVRGRTKACSRHRGAWFVCGRLGPGPLPGAAEARRSASEFQRSGKEGRPQQWSLTKERLNFLYTAFAQCCSVLYRKQEHVTGL